MTVQAAATTPTISNASKIKSSDVSNYKKAHPGATSHDYFEMRTGKSPLKAPAASAPGAEPGFFKNMGAKIKNGASKALDFIKGHKVATAVVAAVAVIGTAFGVMKAKAMKAEMAAMTPEAPATEAQPA